MFCFNQLYPFVQYIRYVLPNDSYGVRLNNGQNRARVMFRTPIAGRDYH
jgi:hypothetical protein